MQDIVSHVKELEARLKSALSELQEQFEVDRALRAHDMAHESSPDEFRQELDRRYAAFREKLDAVDAASEAHATFVLEHAEEFKAADSQP